jgi:hypothetical protein
MVVAGFAPGLRSHLSDAPASITVDQCSANLPDG